MIDPVRLVSDIFKEKNFSYASLRSFSEGFMTRLSNPELNPGGIYNPLLVDTTNRYNDYFGVVEDKLVKEAVKKGLTLSMNQSLDRVYEQLRKMQGLVILKFGKGSDIYEEFIPQKMEEYNNASIDHLPVLLERFAAAANAHLLASFPVEVGNFVSAQNQFTATRQAQKGIFSDVKTLVTHRHEQRKKLTMQLTKSFLIIAADHLENEDRFRDYYDPRYLPIRKARRKKK